MSRRPRSQAVPAAEARARRIPRSRGRAPGPQRARASRIGLAVTLLGLTLIVVGLATAVSQLPPPTPSATPALGPLPIVFGYALDPDTHLVTEPGNRFEPGDAFCYSVNPPTPPGVGSVWVEVVERRGAEEVVRQPPTQQGLRPNATTFGFEVSSEALITGFGYGRFTMRIYLDPAGPVYAQGRFELVEPDVPE